MQKKLVKIKFLPIFFRILYQLMSNKYMKNELKTRMRHAGQLSKFLGGHCKKYYCPTLDGQN